MSPMTATLFILLVVLGTAKREHKLAAWRHNHECQTNPPFVCTDNRCVRGTGCVSASGQQEFMMWWLPVGSLRASPHVHEQDSHQAEAWGSVGGPGLTLYSPLHESRHGKVDRCVSTLSNAHAFERVHKSECVCACTLMLNVHVHAEGSRSCKPTNRICTNSFLLTCTMQTCIHTNTCTHTGFISTGIFCSKSPVTSLRMCRYSIFAEILNVVEVHDVETLSIKFTRKLTAQNPEKRALHVKYLHLYEIRRQRTLRDTARRWRNTETLQMCTIFRIHRSKSGQI